MARKIITVCHCLRFIPASSLIRFAVYGQEAVIDVFAEKDITPEAVPGSVTMETDSDGNVYKRTINFAITDVDLPTARLLQLLKSQDLIVTYTDESGNNRVCGSPFYPLSLDYQDSNGVWNVTISGESTSPDLFLRR